MGMPGKSFQSVLEPHFDLIRDARRKRETWEGIVRLLAVQGVTTTKQAVHAFFKRRLKRRYPLGMAPAQTRPATVTPYRTERPEAERPNLTESLPQPSEGGPDPLTMPARGRNQKSKWKVF
jgi:hypothetical protein